MTKKDLLDKLQKEGQLKEKDRERASQILDALEGMKTWEAGQLLVRCTETLQLLDVCYKEP